MLPFVDPTWHIRDAVDFTGDGKSDILWRNDNGSDVIWGMNGAQIVSQTSIGVVAPDWTVVHHDYLF